MVSVGKSHRTPAKHTLMWKLTGQEVGAAGYIPMVDGLLWLDLTAGDGVVDDGLPWEQNCSPGIAAARASTSKKPITVVLHEIKAATFDLLERNLAEHLPKLGYQFDGGWWTAGNARLQAVHSSGADARVDLIQPRTAVLVTNDPNSIADWAMRDTFAMEIRDRTRWFRAISTMGCNAGGLKRIGYEERLRWYGLIQQQRANLPDYHDLILAAIERDDSQWAYLIESPTAERSKWREKTEAIVHKSFGLHGMTMDTAWLRLQPSNFHRIQDRLFLTRGERSA